MSTSRRPFTWPWRDNILKLSGYSSGRGPIWIFRFVFMEKQFNLNCRLSRNNVDWEIEASRLRTQLLKKLPQKIYRLVQCLKNEKFSAILLNHVLHAGKIIRLLNKIKSCYRFFPGQRRGHPASRGSSTPHPFSAEAVTRHARCRTTSHGSWKPRSRYLKLTNLEPYTNF